MGNITKKNPRMITRYATPKLTSSHTCSHEGCGEVAGYISGAYFVGSRRVRVWVCLAHWSGNVTLVLPTPPDLAAMMEAERIHYEEVNEQYRRNAEPERGESIKTLAPSGHGPSLPGDRVKSWRWGA